MKHTYLYLLIILIFLLPIVSAGQINSLEINTDIEGTYAYNNYIINVVNLEKECADSFNFSLPLGSKIYFVKDQYGDLNYKVNEQNITINLVKCIKDERTIFLKTRSKQIYQINNNNQKYVFDFYYADQIKKFQHILKLPILKKDIYEIEPSVEPFIQEDKLVISWKDYNVSERKIFIVKFKQSSMQNTIYLLLEIIITIIFLIFLIKKFKKYNRNKNIKKKLEILNEKERKIILELLNKEGINQSILKNKLNLTKSNISKIIARLQLRGLIIKKSEGKINKLYLGNKLKKP